MSTINDMKEDKKHVRIEQELPKAKNGEEKS